MMMPPGVSKFETHVKMVEIQISGLIGLFVCLLAYLPPSLLTCLPGIPNLVTIRERERERDNYHPSQEGNKSSKRM